MKTGQLNPEEFRRRMTQTQALREKNNDEARQQRVKRECFTPSQGTLLASVMPKNLQVKS